MRHVAPQRYAEPVSETVFLILLSLAATPRHGYAIMQDVEALTDSRVKLSTGTLYGALRRLLEDGSIRRFAEADPSRDRQAYELTGKGRELVAAEVGRMNHLTAAAQTRLAGREA